MRSRRGELMLRPFIPFNCGWLGLCPGRYSCVVAWEVVRRMPVEGEMMMSVSCWSSWVLDLLAVLVRGGSFL